MTEWPEEIRRVKMKASFNVARFVSLGKKR